MKVWQSSQLWPIVQVWVNDQILIFFKIYFRELKFNNPLRVNRLDREFLKLNWDQDRVPGIFDVGTATQLRGNPLSSPPYR